MKEHKDQLSLSFLSKMATKKLISMFEDMSKETHISHKKYVSPKKDDDPQKEDGSKKQFSPKKEDEPKKDDGPEKDDDPKIDEDDNPQKEDSPLQESIQLTHGDPNIKLQSTNANIPVPYIITFFNYWTHLAYHYVSINTRAKIAIF